MSDPIDFHSIANGRNSILEMQGKVAQWPKDFLYDRLMEIDKWIVAARDAKGLTQGQLAELLGVTRGNISAWENRRHEPSLSQIKRIGVLCGVDATVLLTDNDQGITKLPAKEAWPFSFPISLLETIPHARRRELELIMLGFITESTLVGGKLAGKAG